MSKSKKFVETQEYHNLEMVTFYDTVTYANDRFTVVLQGDQAGSPNEPPVPLAQVSFKRQGNKVMVAGAWKDEATALERAKQVFQQDGWKID